MNSKSIEFQKIQEDVATPNTTRSSFRIPVDKSSDTCFTIDTTEYRVIDVSISGIGIGLEDNTAYSIDEILENCSLQISGLEFASLKGKVVHFSKETVMPLRCGIQWIDLADEDRDRLKQIILNMKDQLFKQK